MSADPVKRRATPSRGRIAAVALTGVAACAAPGPRSPPAPDGPHVTLATFNVLQSASGDEQTVRAIGETGADIVCLQEVSGAWARVIRERYAERYPHAVLEPAGGARGIGVLSRFPILEVRPLPGLRRGFHPALSVVAETPIGPLRILNVHLRGRGQGEGRLAAKYAAFPADHEEEIRRLVGSLEAAPAVVAGDFNEGDRGRAMRWLEARGFENVLPEHSPGTPSWRGRSVAGQLTLTVDHVLHGPTLEARRARVLLQGNSDHLPVITVLARRIAQPPGG